jgi:hypothetical protein
MPVGPWNAARWELPALGQPSYTFRDVPGANRDLSASSLQYVENREHFQRSMGEMVLMCKESMRRRRSLLKVEPNEEEERIQVSEEDSDASTKKKRGRMRRHTGTDKDDGTSSVGDCGVSKPLSLEFLADRLDIDDPCWGYFVRTAESESIKKGMLQGFITVTTFTNWHSSFRWDSLHHEAFSSDPLGLQQDMKSHVRKWDSTGTLARDMQSTVRCGDIHNEGIVWPRIAEISLLGGLGCGRVSESMEIDCQMSP